MLSEIFFLYTENKSFTSIYLDNKAAHNENKYLRLSKTKKNDITTYINTQS